MHTQEHMVHMALREQKDKKKNMNSEGRVFTPHTQSPTSTGSNSEVWHQGKPPRTQGEATLTQL